MHWWNGGDDEAAAAPAPGEGPDAPPQQAQQRALTALAGAGALLVLAGLLLFGGGSLVVLLGFVLLTHAAVVATSWLPPGRLSGRVDDFLDRWVSDVAGGWYGLVGLGVFVQLEAAALMDDIADFSLTRTAVVDVLLPWLIGFSVESMWNMLWAGFWPLLLVREHGPVWMLVFAGLSWAIFYAGSLVFPTEPLPVKPAAAATRSDAATRGPPATFATPPPPPLAARTEVAVPAAPTAAPPPAPPAAPPAPRKAPAAPATPPDATH